MIPTVKVEIAFNAGFLTAPSSRVWTNVSAYLDGTEGISLGYGRDDEFSTASPNTATLTLNNADGRFTPGRTASPYFPNVKIGRPIRISVVYGSTTSVRFTGHISEWPVVWPTGGDEACTVTLTATSVRARLGQTAPLTSAIRAAYLATNPQCYWPLDEDTDSITNGGQQAFRDITNNDTYGFSRNLLGAFATTIPLLLVIKDGSPGPTDEPSLVKIPAFSDSSLLDKMVHYVGGGRVVRLTPGGGGLTMECVARFGPTTRQLVSLANVLSLYSRDLRQAILFNVLALQDVTQLSVEMSLRSAADFTVVSNPGATPTADVIADDEIHHYAFTLTGGNTVRYYIDGTLMATLTLASPNTFTDPFTEVALGTNTLNADLWVGHVAVHNTALSAVQIATRAAAATSATETLGARVARVAGRVGLPSSLISVEPTVAPMLGPQAEADRSAAEVIEEAAASTGGVLFDGRDGVLTLHARNHRYNALTKITLSTTADEIEGDLTPVLDDRYLANRVEVTRGGEGTDTLVRTDSASTTDYGVYTRSMTVISIEDTEAEAAALNTLRRYAQPVPRVATVTVDISDLSTAQRNLMLQVEVGSLIGLSGLPNQAPSTVLKLFVEGASESITPDAHLITLNTTAAEDATGWVLGSASFSVLGSTTRPVY